jgi:hypothetical protein
MTDSELSRGVIAYLQRGQAASPRADRAAVLATATTTPPEELLQRVEAVVAESLSVAVDWDTLSLGDAGRLAAHETVQRHPDLSDEAAEALAWNFTFAWR